MTSTIENIPLQQLASGDHLSLQVYKFVGTRPGKKGYIQSNLHGGELADNVVVHYRSRDEYYEFRSRDSSAQNPAYYQLPCRELCLAGVRVIERSESFQNR